VELDLRAKFSKGGTKVALIEETVEWVRPLKRWARLYSDLVWMGNMTTPVAPTAMVYRRHVKRDISRGCCQCPPSCCRRGRRAWHPLGLVAYPFPGPALERRICCRQCMNFVPFLRNLAVLREIQSRQPKPNLRAVSARKAPGLRIAWTQQAFAELL